MPNSSTLNSYCPFRVQTHNHQAGCTLQFGKMIECYTQEKRPLLRKNDSFICPKMSIKIAIKLFNQLETLLGPLMCIQDEYEIAINVWPTIKGIANPKNITHTLMGTDMVELAKQIDQTLAEIIFELY
ncbi:MAG: hypothetical protein ACFFFH_01695 [Candidatus Thorarchaeota archaeon]